MAVSGVAVGIAAAGAVFAYGAITNRSPLAALQKIIQGQTPSNAPTLGTATAPTGPSSVYQEQVPTGESTDLATLVQQAGFTGDGAKYAYAIVMEESHGHYKAYNGDILTGDQSYGLMQINMKGALGPQRRALFGIQSNSELFDPLTNLRAGYILSNGGTDFGPWGIGPNAYKDNNNGPWRQYFGQTGAQVSP